MSSRSSSLSSSSSAAAPTATEAKTFGSRPSTAPRVRAAPTFSPPVVEALAPFATRTKCVGCDATPAATESAGEAAPRRASRDRLRLRGSDRGGAEKDAALPNVSRHLLQRRVLCRAPTGARACLQDHLAVARVPLSPRPHGARHTPTPRRAILVARRRRAAHDLGAGSHRSSPTGRRDHKTVGVFLFCIVVIVVVAATNSNTPMGSIKALRGEPHRRRCAHLCDRRPHADPAARRFARRRAGQGVGARAREHGVSAGGECTHVACGRVCDRYPERRWRILLRWPASLLERNPRRLCGPIATRVP